MMRLKKLKLTVVTASLLIAVASLAGHAWAQSASMAATAQSGDAKVEQDANGALYLDFKGATLLNVLNSLSQISKINFVAGSEIAKREVNMSLDGVTLEQALHAISNGSNVTYAFMPESNIIMFRASSDAPQLAPLYTRVFKLYFLRASKIQEIDAGASSGGGSGSKSGGGGLQSLNSGKSNAAGDVIPILKIMEKMLSERGSVAVDDRSNSLIVTDTEDRLDRVATVVAELDRPLNQVLINVLLVETFEDLDREFGIEWGGGNVGKLTGAGAKSTKFPYNLGDSIPFASGKKGDNFLNNLNGDGDFTTTDAVVNGNITFANMTATAKALQTASKLRILAKPNILVMDNHPAIIKIATNAAIGNQTVATAGGADSTSTTSTEAERAEVGTILRVTPQINSQDQITMTIEPIFATLDDSTVTLTGNATGDTTVRAARTTVMVNSGKTLVMGGLLFSNQSDGDTKIPFLGDLPVLGRIFTSDHKTIQDRELVLFITPQIIKNPAAMNPSNVPDRQERFDDVNANFWKYKKKTWYKNVAAAGPQAPIDYDSFFKVRENVMDKMAGELQGGKDSAMKKEFQKAGQPTELKWEVH